MRLSFFDGITEPAEFVFAADAFAVAISHMSLPGGSTLHESWSKPQRAS